jgi:type VI protein secretion system component VasK
MAAPRTTNALSTPVKGALAIVFAVAIVAIVWCLRRDTFAALIVCGGTVLVALVLLGYALVLQRLRHRRSSPMAQAILNNSGASPNSISQPGRRAALDDLRKKFQVGINKFSAAGKDLYSLPWYIVVGEPGGGKTEAIRHCNVGFPPGLQDYTQGAGGTLNMNWWFTNHAILLDTAGRMLFEEAPPGTTSEWDEFLQLLVKTRSECPVNGMLLVLPADSLITDSADEIEQKATRIAQQLDHIQRALCVRFPVFIVITKCDLINGFREFFDGLTDPQLQHQMLGWSNPQPLDEPFRPVDVDRYLQSIRQRLVSRCQSLLVDPINTDDPTASRLNQVDALYAFPDSFVKIAPRLRRYLEMIFVVGEWSPDPLFLRGIYFTSSMREGSALDADLAEALKVPVESLKGDGRSWERERAYFLRDVFMAKAFRERGLVTRAANTKRLQRRRRALLVGTAIFAVLTLGLLTWTGTRAMQSGIGDQTDYWLSVGANWHDRRPQWSIVQPANDAAAATAGSTSEPSSGPATGWRYAGFEELSLGENTTTVGQFFSDRATYEGAR